MQSIICPVCRQALKKEDLPLAVQRAPEPPAGNAAHARTQQSPPATDEVLMVASCCCCCVLVGQLYELALRRRRACVGVASGLWLLFILSAIPELVGTVLDMSDAADVRTAVANETLRFVGLNHAFDHLLGRVDLSSSTDRLGLALRAASACFFCALWISATCLLARSRKVLRERHRLSATLDYPVCCVPCAVVQLLSVLGLTARQYRLCAPLPLHLGGSAARV